MHRRAGDREAMKSLQIISNLARPEVVVLPHGYRIVLTTSALSPAAISAVLGPDRINPPSHRAHYAAAATCRTSSVRFRRVGRCARHSRHSWPPGVASAASSSTAFALNSSSGLHLRFLGLEAELDVTSVPWFRKENLQAPPGFEPRMFGCYYSEVAPKSTSAPATFSQDCCAAVRCARPRTIRRAWRHRTSTDPQGQRTLPVPVTDRLSPAFVRSN